MSVALAFLNMPEGLEWLLVGVLVLLLYGRETPSMMRKLGATVRDFRNALLGMSRLGEPTHPEAPPVGERAPRPPSAPRDPLPGPALMPIGEPLPLPQSPPATGDAAVPPDAATDPVASRP